MKLGPGLRRLTLKSMCEFNTGQPFEKFVSFRLIQDDRLSVREHDPPLEGILVHFNDVPRIEDLHALLDIDDLHEVAVHGCSLFSFGETDVAFCSH
jgi:hypothetical protein